MKNGLENFDLTPFKQCNATIEESLGDYVGRVTKERLNQAVGLSSAQAGYITERPQGISRYKTIKLGDVLESYLELRLDKNLDVGGQVRLKKLRNQLNMMVSLTCPESWLEEKK